MGQVSPYISSDANPINDPGKATVFIAHSDPDLVRAVSALVRSADYHSEAYASAEGFLKHYNQEKSGCLLLDIRLPGMSGIELQEHLRNKQNAPPVIFVTAYGDVSIVTKAIRAGAVDVIEKPFDAATLLGRVEEAVQQDSINRKKSVLKADVKQRISRLTDRELEIMRLLALGKTSKQIGHSLSISNKTAANHRAKVLEKMCVDNPTQLAHVLALLN
jgi:two-component system, LuxR family, response regulator FixJ